MIERKRTIKNKVDDKTTEINNNINIKVSNEQPPVPEVPVKKKRKKRKKKISKAVKDDFLNTLNEYKASGGTDSAVNIGDIKKLTEPEIIDITNNLRTKILALKAPPVPPKAIGGAPSQMALTAPQTRMALPPPTTDYNQIPARASQGFSNLRPSSLPPVEVRPSSLPPVEKRETSLQPRTEDKIYKLFDLLTEVYVLQKNNENPNEAYLKSVNYYILNKEYFNTLNDKRILYLIINYITDRTTEDLTDDEKREATKFFINSIVRIRKEIGAPQPPQEQISPEASQPSSELVPSILPFSTPEEYKKSIILLNADADENKINTYFEGFKRWNATNNIVNIVGTETTEDKLGILIRFMNQYQYTLKSPAPPTPSEAPPPTPSEAPPSTPSEEPVSPDTLKLNQSPKMFYEKWYPNGNYSGSNTKGPPSVKELQNIIKIQDPSAVVSGKLKGDLIRTFQELYKDSLIANPEPTTSPEPQPTPVEMQPTTPEPPPPPTPQKPTIPPPAELMKFVNKYYKLNDQGKREYNTAVEKPAVAIIQNIIKKYIIPFNDPEGNSYTKKYYQGDWEILRNPWGNSVFEGLTVEEITDIYIENFLEDFTFLYETPPTTPEFSTPRETQPTEITPEDLKLINIAEDEENLETLQTIYKKYFGKNYEYKRENIGERVFDIIAELKKPLPSTSTELTYKTITEYTPETCKDKPGRKLLSGVFNPCLSEYENYLKSLIDTNNRSELEVQYQRALGRQAPSTSNNVLLVNQIIEQSDYVPQLANDNFYKYEALKKNVPIVPQTQEGRSANLKQAVEQRISQDNEVTIALLVTLASYDVERPTFIYQYDYIPELSDEELAVYAESDGRNIVVGNRGSTTLEDWVDTDITLAFGKLADSSERWSRTLQKIKKIADYNFNNNNDSFIFTGDSLGGSLAYEQAVYVYQNRPQFNSFDSYAITFNAGQGLPSSSQFFAFLKENLFKDEWYKTHLLNFTVTGDIISNLGRAIGAGTQISVPWSVSGQPHNLENFVKFNVDSYKDFVDTEQAPRVKSQKTTGNQPIPQDEGYDYKTLGLVVGAGVLAGGLVGVLTKNPQLAARAGYYSTRALGPTVARGVALSGRNAVTGAALGGTAATVEESIRQNLQAGSKPQFFGNLPPQYKAPKTPFPPRLGQIPESENVYSVLNKPPPQPPLNP
jgi:hypothetical protein